MAVRGIELTHEFCCTFVMYLPQAYHQGLSPGIEEAAHQPDQLVSADDHVHPRATAAQGHQFSLQLQLIQVKKAEQGITQPYGRKHRVVLSKITMVGIVNKTALRAICAQLLLPGLIGNASPRDPKG